MSTLKLSLENEAQQERRDRWSANTLNASLRPQCPDSLVAGSEGIKLPQQAEVDSESLLHRESAAPTAVATSSKSLSPKSRRRRDIMPRSPTRTSSKSKGMGEHTKLQLGGLQPLFDDDINIEENSQPLRSALGSMAPISTRTISLPDQQSPHQEQEPSSRWSSLSAPPVPCDTSTSPKTNPTSRGSASIVLKQPRRFLSPRSCERKVSDTTAMPAHLLQKALQISHSSTPELGSSDLSVTLRSCNKKVTSSMVSSSDRYKSLQAALGPMALTRKGKESSSKGSLCRPHSSSALSLSSCLSAPSLEQSQKARVPLSPCPRAKSPKPVRGSIRAKSRPRSSSPKIGRLPSLDVDLDIIEEVSPQSGESQQQQQDEGLEVPTMSRRHTSFEDFKAARNTQKRRNRKLSNTIKSQARQYRKQLQQHQSEGSFLQKNMNQNTQMKVGGGMNAPWDTAPTKQSYMAPIPFPPTRARSASPHMDSSLKRSKAPPTWSLLGDTPPPTALENEDRWAPPSSFKKRIESDSGLNRPRRLSSPTLLLRKRATSTSMTTADCPVAKGNTSWDDLLSTPSGSSSSRVRSLHISAALVLSMA